MNKSNIPWIIFLVVAYILTILALTFSQQLFNPDRIYKIYPCWTLTTKGDPAIQHWTAGYLRKDWCIKY